LVVGSQFSSSMVNSRKNSQASSSSITYFAAVA
jgi:hypothetical protein